MVSIDNSPPEPLAAQPRTEWPLLLALAAALTLLHLLTNGRYGFHRDEWQFLSDASHLDWGFVPYPPLTAFLEHIGLSLFGLSLVGLRLFSVLAQAAAVVVTGLMTKELGGGKLAQFAAALAIALSPLPLFEGTEFQYSSFDYLWWVLAFYFTVRLLREEDPRYWLAIGAALGLGLETKYSIAFLIAGLLCGLILTSARRFFASPWFWAGVAVALLIFLPNLLWLLRHDFISYRFLQHIHTRDVGEGRAEGFLQGQFRICLNMAAAPLAIAGLVAFFRSPRFRLLAWMALIPVLLFWLAKGRAYYDAAVYPPLVAMGAVAASRWLASLPRPARLAVQSAFFAALVLVGAYASAVIVPFASSGPLRDFAVRNNGDLREEFGWHELVTTIASIRDSLSPEQQAHLGITVANYGEYGSIELLGPSYHLPPPIGTTNSAWARGYPTPEPTTLIVVGLDAVEANSIFTGCRLAGHNGNALGVRNEESQYHPGIFLCGPPRKPWSVLWQEHRDFG
jgi:hypothetical protein